MEIAFFVPVLVVLLFSIVIHEVAHAFVARMEGDDTAERAGRITLNPIPHLDLWGSLIIPVGLLVSGSGLIFGWAKPVPVNPGNFDDYKWGDIRVSLAGIASNLALAFLFTVVTGLLITVSSASGGAVPGGMDGGIGGGFGGLIDSELLATATSVAHFGILINLILAVFNLAPIPPLDGSHVMYHLLPREWADTYRRLGRYGLIVLFLAVFFLPQTFDVLLWPVARLMDVAYGFIDLWA
ncbi:MAG: site-2 protease family protein [Gemmatimonadota bacterium]